MYRVTAAAVAAREEDVRSIYGSVYLLECFLCINFLFKRDSPLGALTQKFRCITTLATPPPTSPPYNYYHVTTITTTLATIPPSISTMQPFTTPSCIITHNTTITTRNTTITTMQLRITFTLQLPSCNQCQLHHITTLQLPPPPVPIITLQLFTTIKLFMIYEQVAML